MWKTKKREEMVISKKEALELNKLNNYPSQRTIKQKHLDEIKRAIKEETFRTGHIAIAILKDKTKKIIKYLVNGQHQIRAVIDLDSAIYAFYEEIECETMEDIAELYGTFDQGGRGLYDLITPWEDALNLPWDHKFTKLILASGIYKDGRTNWDRQRKSKSLPDYVKIGEDIYQIFNVGGKIPWKECAHVARRSVVSVMMLTLEKHPDKARGWWSKVLDGVDVKKGDPARTLRDQLLSTPVALGRGGQNYKKLPEKDIQKKCIIAWNAFMRNLPTQLKVYNGEMPKVL
jgi:hypothetical protein